MRPVSIIIPTIRPEKAQRCMRAIERDAAADGLTVQIMSWPDTDGIGCPRMVANMTRATQYDLVMFLGDDTIPQRGFLQAALDAMDGLPDAWGVVGLNTQDDKAEDGANYRAHWLADKRMLGLIPGGEFFSTEYRHCYGDDELMDIAMENGRWVAALHARVLHDHPINGGESDAGYERAYSDNAAADRRTYQRRKVSRIRTIEGRRLAICWPVTNLLAYADFAISYAAMEKPRHLFMWPEQINGQDVTGTAKNIDQIRNSLVDRALSSGCTHVLMMDTDQCYRTTTMIRRLFSHEKAVVGARVHRRYPPFDPLLFRWDDEAKKYTTFSFDEAETAIDAGELVEVDATGAGCVLFDTQVFFDIEPPWFEFGLRDGRPVGEDITFCEKLRSAGHRIFVDTSIDIQHLTIRGVGMGDYWLQHSLTERRRKDNGERIETRI
jgi:hypothetical protein